MPKPEAPLCLNRKELEMRLKSSGLEETVVAMKAAKYDIAIWRMGIQKAKPKEASWLHSLLASLRWR